MEFIVINAGAEKPAGIPMEVTRRQALQALVIAGYDDDVEAALAGIEDPVDRKLAKIEWDASQVFKRDRPLVIKMGAALGLSPSQLDDLFKFAATL